MLSWDLICCLSIWTNCSQTLKTGGAVPRKVTKITHSASIESRLRHREFQVPTKRPNKPISKRKETSFDFVSCFTISILKKHLRLYQLFACLNFESCQIAIHESHDSSQSSKMNRLNDKTLQNRKRKDFELKELKVEYL